MSTGKLQTNLKRKDILQIAPKDFLILKQFTTYVENVSQSAKSYLQDVLKMSFQDRQDILPRHLADVQKMS